MPKGFTGELIHFNATRMRAVGEGTLKQTFYSLDDIQSEALQDYPLATTANQEISALANFREQYGQLEVEVTDLGDWFQISRIVIFVKQLASGYPQG